MRNDLRYAFRALRKTPAFTTVAVLVLALGIGANTAIFSVVNAVVLRELPYRDPGRMVMIWADNPKLKVGITELPSSPSDYVEMQREKAFERVATFNSQQVNLAADGAPYRVAATEVTDGFFETFGVAPALGRTFRPEEQARGSHNVVILSHALWTRAFGASPAVIGHKVLIDQVDNVVVGVMPPSFTYPRGSELPAPYGFAPETEIWRPRAFSSQELSRQNNRSYPVVARLAGGVGLDEANAALRAVAQRQHAKAPEMSDWTFRAIPFRDSVVGRAERLILLVSIAVGLILLIACSNVANLFLARAAGRDRETAVRVALGAGKTHIVRQVLCESLVLAAAGAAFGLILAFWSLKALLALAPADLPRLTETTIDGTVLLFTLGLTVLTAFVFGLAPAVALVRTNLNASLKEGSRGSDGSGRRRVRNLLTAAEVALAVVLLVGAGLLIRSFNRLYSVDPGFQAQSVLTFDVALPGKAYDTKEKVLQFYSQLEDRLAASAGVVAVGAISAVPLGGSENLNLFVPETLEGIRKGQEPFGDERRVNSGYFRAAGIPLLAGRFFSDHDTASSNRVLIVNQTLAGKFFPDGAVGRRIRVGGTTGDWRQVVGVVADVRQTRLDAEPRPQMYLPHSQNADRSQSLIVRTAGNPLGLIDAVRAAVRSVDPKQPIGNVRTMEQVLNDSVSRQRFTAVLLALFAGTAMLLSVVGLYGVMAYNVAQRTREIGVRMALGAARTDILRSVLIQSMAWVAAGAVVGFGGALALGRVISSMLYGVSATDPVTFAVVLTILFLTALAAAWLPARRAASVDPMVALRYE